MSEQKDLITFEQSLPIISHSLDTLLFTGLSTNLQNLYRTYVDFVRRESEDLAPVSFVTFARWFMEKPYFFKFNDESKVVGVFKDLSKNPDYKSLEKFLNFYIVWKLDLAQDTKEALGICFAEDATLNTSQKIKTLQEVFNLQMDFIFYDVDIDNNLIPNKVFFPFISINDIQILQKILESGWHLCGVSFESESEFWKILQKHTKANQKI